MGRALAAKELTMGSRIKRHSVHKGVPIYSAAKTHPNAKSTSLLLFTEDIFGYIGENKIKRFRYKKMSADEHTKAYVMAMRFINSFIK